MNNKEILSAAYQENRDKWLNADSFTDDYEDDDRFSAKYSIQIVQTRSGSSNPIPDVDVGDAYVNRSANNFGQVSSITITSTIVGTSYLEFLAASEAEPFIVGRTTIVSTSAGQIEYPITITHRNANGERKDHVITPTIDPYQVQTDRVIDDFEYMFDGMSRLRFSNINQGATVTIKMYMMHKWSATQQMAGRDPKISYQKPQSSII